MPEGAVFVGRGSHLGNPFRIYEHCTGPDGDWGLVDTGRLNSPLGHGWTREGAARAAVESYQRVFDDIYPEGSSARFAVLVDLCGKDIVCWCAIGDPCHGDFLLELANTPQVRADAAALELARRERAAGSRPSRRGRTAPLGDTEPLA